MKKIFSLLLILISISHLSAQQSIDWKRIDIGSGGGDYSSLYQFNNNTKETILITTNKKAVSDDELLDYSRNSAKIKNNHSRNFKLTQGSSFENGSQNESVSSNGSYDENIGNNKAGVIVDEKKYFSETPLFTQSFDSNYLIVSDFKILQTANPKDKKRIRHYVTVYDKNLDLVWTDSIDFSKIFTIDKVVESYYFEFNNGKLYIIGSNNGVPSQSIKPGIFVVQCDKPQAYKIVLNQTFQHNTLGWNYVFTKDNYLLICGVNIAHSNPLADGYFSSLYTLQDAEKNLFFTSLDLKNGVNLPPIEKEWDIDKNFTHNYPDYESILDGFLGFPMDILLVEDGIIFSSEYAEFVHESGQMGSIYIRYRPITLIKFDFQGNIAWLKMINKDISSANVNNRYSCHSFVRGNKIVIFYYDFIKNVSSNTLKTNYIACHKSFCVVTAIVDAKGDIKKTQIYNLDDTGIFMDLRRITQIDYNHFFMQGHGITRKSKGDYNCIFTMNE